MYKKTIMFEDLEGNPVERNFFFNLSKPELVKMEANTPGGMASKIERLTKSPDLNEIVKLIEELITISYGEKDEDGISFIKVRNGVKLGEKFKQTDAYNVLFSELVNAEDTEGKAFNEFLTGILPSDLLNQAKIEQQKFLSEKK